jgi:hypothetical protein
LDGSDEQLKAGDRVRLSDAGRRNSRTPERKGVVAGRGKSRSQFKIMWDGLKLPQLMHRTHLERDGG